jgi:hypothetical protein
MVNNANSAVQNVEEMKEETVPGGAHLRLVGRRRQTAVDGGSSTKGIIPLLRPMCFKAFVKQLSALFCSLKKPRFPW